MECTQPYMPLGPFGVRFRCGSCLACRMWRTQEWATRIQHEMLEHKGSCFVTLTYDWDHVPWAGRWLTLRKTHLQLFMKRLRKSLGTRRIKYFACGEYGGRLGRPHYHLIILGLSAAEHEIYDKEPHEGVVLSGPVYDAWKNGIVHMGTVNPKSIKYVVGYINDKPTYKEVRRHASRWKLVERPFQLASTRMGHAWAMRHKDQLLELGGITVHGVQVGTPRYYRKQLGMTAEAMPELAKRAQAKQGRLIEKLVVRYLEGTVDSRGMTVEEYLRKSVLEYRRSSDAKLKARAALRRKGQF